MLTSMRRLAAFAALVALAAACGTSSSDDPIELPARDAEEIDAASDAPPAPIGSDDPPAFVEVGAFGGCVVSRAGMASCWGSAALGALGVPPAGDGVCDGAAPCRARPTPIPNLGQVVKLSVGLQHVCAVVAGGAVYCWGNNAEGALGRGNATPASSYLPSIVQGIPPAIDVVAGRQATCARVVEDGGTGVYCWGLNEQGMLGPDVPLGAFSGPRRFTALANTKRIAVSSIVPVACAIDADDRVSCWGRNYLGVLGHLMGTPPDEACSAGGAAVFCRRTPSRVGDATFTVDDIAVGYFVGCARRRDGTLMCWGSNEFGMLGAGLPANSTSQHPAPVAVPNLAGASSFSVRHAHACAVKDGQVSCWGMNAWGDLGDGFASAVCHAPWRCSNAPVAVSLPIAVSRVLAGPHFSVAHAADFTAFSWGANIDARLGHLPGQSNDVSVCGAGTGRCNPNPQPISLRP